MIVHSLTNGLLVGATSFLLPMAVQAETDATAEKLLTYDQAMRCGALHTFLSVVNEDDKKQEKIHDDIATGWLALAMVRDGDNGNKADQEFEPLVGKLVDHINGMEEDSMVDFLEEGSALCGALEEVNKKELNSVMAE